MHLPPETVTINSSNPVKLTHLIYRIRQQLSMPDFMVTVYHDKKTNTIGMHAWAPKTDLIYIPDLRLDDLENVRDVDSLSEEMVIEIRQAFEGGEEVFLSGQ